MTTFGKRTSGRARSIPCPTRFLSRYRDCRSPCWCWCWPGPALLHRFRRGAATGTALALATALLLDRAVPAFGTDV